MTNHIGYVVAVLGGFGALLQAVPAPEQNTIDQAQRLGITGMLAIAVVVLWRKLQEKDKAMAEALAAKDATALENYRVMAQALAQNKVLYEKQAETLDEIRESVANFVTVRGAVGKGPDGHGR